MALGQGRFWLRREPSESTCLRIRHGGPTHRLVPAVSILSTVQALPIRSQQTCGLRPRQSMFQPCRPVSEFITANCRKAGLDRDRRSPQTHSLMVDDLLHFGHCFPLSAFPPGVDICGVEKKSRPLLLTEHKVCPVLPQSAVEKYRIERGFPAAAAVSSYGGDSGEQRSDPVSPDIFDRRK